MPHRYQQTFLAYLLVLGTTAFSPHTRPTFMARKFTFELQSSNDESPARPQENLNPDPERLLALKKREAEVKLELDRISAEKSALLQTRRLSIGIVGFGKFGQFMAKRFLAQGHTVSALSRAESSRDASDMGVTYFGGFDIDTNSNGEGGSAWEFMSQPHLDVVIFAVSILSFEACVRSLPLQLLACQPHGPRPPLGAVSTREDSSLVDSIDPARPGRIARGGALLVDVLSVKMHPRAVLQTVAPPSCDVLCTHPMFGPESGRGSWQGLPFVYEKVAGRQLNKDQMETFLSIFETEGCTMVEMDSEAHDLNSANSQFATHLVGRLLEQLRLTPTPIDTTAFKRMLALKDTVAGDSFDLFYGLYKYNPNSVDTLLLLRRALVDLEWRLKEMEQADMGTVGWKLPRPKATTWVTSTNASASEVSTTSTSTSSDEASVNSSAVGL